MAFKGLMVSTSEIMPGAITTTLIADNSITTGKIVAGAVTSAKIAANTIVAGNIAAGTITTTEIAANTIVAGNIAAGTITTTQIAANTIVAGNIAAGTITTTQIAANTITAANIAAGTITTTEIAAGTILGGNIASGTVTGGNIAAGTITAANITAATITANEIAANTIVAANIVAGTITGTLIANATVTGGNIANATITGSNIAASTITAANIAAGTITATEIAANTITGAKIAANTIAAANIVAGTITGTEIAASTITAAKLSITTLSAVAADTGTLTVTGVLTLSGSGEIQTASSGQRIEITAANYDRITFYSGATNENAAAYFQTSVAGTNEPTLFIQGPDSSSNTLGYVNLTLGQISDGSRPQFTLGGIVGGTPYITTANAADRMDFYVGGGFILYLHTAGIGVGTTRSVGRIHVYGAGNQTADWANSDPDGQTLYLQSSGGASGDGGQILFGSSQGVFAGIKAFVVNGTGPSGRLYFQTRNTSGNVVKVMELGGDQLINFWFTAQMRAAYLMGYGSGAGGTVTQLTGKTTGVTLNAPSGQITTHNGTINAAAEATFRVTNSTVAATDAVIVNHASGGTNGAYGIAVSAVGAGYFDITLSNWSGTNKAEAIVLNFAVIKGSSA